MKKSILLLLCFVCASLLFAQKTKTIKKQAAKVPATMSCCIESKDDMPAGSAADFVAVANTSSFASLHEEPLPFVLENQKGSMVMINCADGMPANAYAIPAKEATVNFLIVIQEWWGLNDYIKQEAERYYTALDGKVNVIAIDLYDGKVATTTDSAKKYVTAAMQGTRKETILKGALDYAGKGANVQTIGWCFGGMMSLQTAIMGGDLVQGCVMFYGTPEKDATKLKKVKCDVLGIFGTQDKSIPKESVEALGTTLTANGRKFELHWYDAPHAFANPSNPGYNKEYGDDAFSKAVVFLRKRMK